jgi:hypothetical protein
MKTCQCSIGIYTRTIEAETPEAAAQRCAELRARGRDWFANETPMAASVVVDGIEYEPAAYAGPESEHVWGE